MTWLRNKDDAAQTQASELFSTGTTHLLTHLQVAENNAQNRYKVTKKQRMQQCDSRLCNACVTRDRRMMTVMRKRRIEMYFCDGPTKQTFVAKMKRRKKSI